jgi:hypothetical protein
MSLPRSSKAAEQVIGRTIRFSPALRARILSDAERCGRSFEGQVIALLRRHYGEDVDLAPAPELVLSLARGSLAGMSSKDRRQVSRRLMADDD